MRELATFCGTALVLAVAFCGGACKRDDCARAIDHVGHLSWLESQKMLEKISPEVRAETVKVLPTEEMMRTKMREIVGNRFGARCHDPAFAKCVLAAEDPAAVARCEHPAPSP